MNQVWLVIPFRCSASAQSQCDSELVMSRPLRAAVPDQHSICKQMTKGGFSLAYTHPGAVGMGKGPNGGLPCEHPGGLGYGPVLLLEALKSYAPRACTGSSTSPSMVTQHASVAVS